MSWIVLQSMYVALVTGTPLLVAGLIAATARHEVASLEPSLPPEGRAPRALLLATLASWAVFGVWFAADPRGLAVHRHDLQIAAAELMGFVFLAALALASIRKTVSKARRIVTEVAGVSGKRARHASLAPRRLTDCLPWPLIGAPYLLAALCASLLAWRFAGFGSRPDRPFIPLGLALAGTVFLLLYGAWLRDESREAQPLEASPRADIEALDRRQRRTRAIFVAQLVLVAVFFASALVLSNWSNPIGFPMGVLSLLAAGLVGVLGCALAMSSGVGRRYLETIDWVSAD
jgi:hypothetical protein